MKRLFVGIRVPSDVREKIKPVQDSLVQTGVDLTLVSLDNLHFTLKFLGNEDESKIPQIEEKLQKIVLNTYSFSFSVQGVGCFPNAERISVIWIGAQSKELVSLMKELNQSLDYVHKNEHEEEIPHLTIARVKSGKNKEELRKAVVEFSGIVFGNVFVDRIILFESVLTPQGPVYSVVKEFLLRS